MKEFFNPLAARELTSFLFLFVGVFLFIFLSHILSLPFPSHCSSLAPLWVLLCSSWGTAEMFPPERCLCFPIEVSHPNSNCCRSTNELWSDLPGIVANVKFILQTGNISEQAHTDFISGTRDENFHLCWVLKLSLSFRFIHFRKIGCCTASSKFRYRHSWKQGCCQADSELDVKWWEAKE